MNKTETSIALLLLALAILLLNPFGFFMPSAVLMTLIGLLVAAAALFAGVVWREYSGDEREVFHRMFAGRSAFIVGTSVLVVGIAIQSLSHSVDSWLVAALVSMVLVKIIGRVYADKTS